MPLSHAGIKAHGTVQAPGGSGGGPVYAYEVDGAGGALADFDDANLPSLVGEGVAPPTDPVLLQPELQAGLCWPA